MGSTEGRAGQVLGTTVLGRGTGTRVSRAITEEVLVVRALRTMTLAPRTVSQVSVVIPTPRWGGTVMVEGRARSTGIVPGARGDRGGTGQSNLGGQPRVTPSGDRGEPSDSDSGVRDRNTRDMP